MDKKKRPRPKPIGRIEEEKKKAKDNKRLGPSAGGAPWLPNARDLEIYAIYCEGDKSERELAKVYKLSAPTIHQIIRKVEAHFAAESVMQIRELRARATKRFEALFSKAIQSYKRSLEDEVTITDVTEPDGTIKHTEQRRGQAGSPAFLNQAREAMSELLDVWGAKAPKSMLIDTNEHQRVGGLTPQEALAKRIAHLQAMAGELAEECPSTS